MTEAMRNFFRLAMSSAFALAAVLSASCERIFEDVEDCSSTWSVRFVYRKNREMLQSVTGQGPDAFATSVASVHLWVFDKKGNLVFEGRESGGILASGDWTMPLELPADTYDMIAWCGIDGSNAFELTEADALPLRSGDRQDDLNVSVRLDDDGKAWHGAPYDALFYGRADNVKITEEIGNNEIEIELVKDVNDLIVWVQHPSAEVFAENSYTVVFTEANGSMTAANETCGPVIEYLPHKVSLLEVDSEFNGETMHSGAMVAHLSTSRIIASHSNDARLEIRSGSGDTVFSVPIVKYLLEMKSERFSRFDDQTYLDCEDTYNCSFFLSGDSGYWTASRIIINSWVRVSDQVTEI